MADRLIDSYGASVPRLIAAQVAAVHPAFPARRFVADALDGHEALDLMARGRHWAEALARHLPGAFPEAAAILVRSLGPPLTATEGHGMAPFLYLPHSLYVARHGLGHFEPAMAAFHAITQRFSAEFGIRPFLEREPRATLARLAEWARDPSVHVRRLVSEGTRPRLPWAPRLAAFQRDPAPVLSLLERLRDDPEGYVRRSVANNLNDIGKDHPALLIATARRWLEGAGEGRRWIVGHALRSRLRAGDPEALALLGYGERARVAVRAVEIAPARARLGGSVAIAFEVAAAGRRPQRLRVDLRVFYVKASGGVSPKVFRLAALELAPGEAVRLQRRLSLAEMTTRRHYPGEHRVEAVVNGASYALGGFRVVAPRG